MTEDQLVSLGAFSKELLGSEAFNVVVNLYETGRTRELLQTKYEDAKERERIYTQITGLGEFLAFMKTIVDKHDELVNPTPVDPDAPGDDPSVHDIFKGY
jgi:hypothetical protein